MAHGSKFLNTGSEQGILPAACIVFNQYMPGFCPVPSATTQSRLLELMYSSGAECENIPAIISFIPEQLLGIKTL